MKRKLDPGEVVAFAKNMEPRANGKSVIVRPLYCPICSAKVMVEVDDTNFPEIHRLPDHAPAMNVNLCCGVVVTVTLDWDECSKCKAKMGKHPSGLCRVCFGTTS